MPCALLAVLCCAASPSPTATGSGRTGSAARSPSCRAMAPLFGPLRAEGVVGKRNRPSALHPPFLAVSPIPLSCLAAVQMGVPAARVGHPLPWPRSGHGQRASGDDTACQGPAAPASRLWAVPARSRSSSGPRFGWAARDGQAAPPMRPSPIPAPSLWSPMGSGQHCSGHRRLP